MDAFRQAHASDKRIETLDLSYSNLTSIPEEVFSLSHLVSLRLDNNAIEGVDWKRLMAMSNLQNLNLSYNHIVSLPASLSNWDTVRILNLSHNRVKELPRPDFWRLFHTSDYIIPLMHNARPELDHHSEETTRELLEKYGKNMPRVILHTWKYTVSDGYDDTWLAEATKYVTVGEPYWRRTLDTHPRIRLEGNPVIETEPRILGAWRALSEEWKAEENTRTSAAKQDEKARRGAEKKEREAERRTARHDERLKEKGLHHARDSKHTDG